MKFNIITLFAGLLLAVAANAQVVVMDYDLIQRNRNITVKLSLQDAKSEDPLPFATVYLNPQGDTTITHFALSDQEGKVEIGDVPVGRYRVNVEMIGYTPFVKEYTFRSYEEMKAEGIPTRYLGVYDTTDITQDIDPATLI